MSEYLLLSITTDDHKSFEITFTSLRHQSSGATGHFSASELFFILRSLRAFAVTQGPAHMCVSTFIIRQKELKGAISAASTYRSFQSFRTHDS